MGILCHLQQFDLHVQNDAILHYPALNNSTKLGVEFVAASEGAFGRKIEALRPFAPVGCRPRRMALADGKVWTVFQRTFSQVQFLLDHNRLLIKEINVNQESQIPESLSRNVLLIKELNHNIKKVVELYAGLSAPFVRPFENMPEATAPKLSHESVDQGQKRTRSS